MGGMDARQWIVELVEAPATRKNARAVVVAAMKHNPHNQNKATGHAADFPFCVVMPVAARAVLRTHEGDVAKRASPHLSARRLLRNLRGGSRQQRRRRAVVTRTSNKQALCHSDVQTSFYMLEINVFNSISGIP